MIEYIHKKVTILFSIQETNIFFVSYNISYIICQCHVMNSYFFSKFFLSALIKDERSENSHQKWSGHYKGGEARSHAPPPPIFQNLPKRRFNIESFPQCLSQNDMPKYVFAKVEFGFLSFLIKTLIMWTKFWEHITFFGKTGMNIKSGQDMKIIHISIANNM